MAFSTSSWLMFQLEVLRIRGLLLGVNLHAAARSAKLQNSRDRSVAAPGARRNAVKVQKHAETKFKRLGLTGHRSPKTRYDYVLLKVTEYLRKKKDS